ncbi:unnamed protein product [Caenorhabditis auriculariae]|uniref:Peptidase metallopeptidase domain-containing protein n=1 Tax=Caenorhabditis auriculariae TaxID=2777116 RepID=A0A8S1HJ01_9PELO|nr:unnamed protein product [Caenorhabditis auriculariae]
MQVVFLFSRSPPPVTDDKAKRYLQDFGYVQASSVLSSRPGMQGDVSGPQSLLKLAISKFQEFAGLAKTGILDTATKIKMALPRCGVTDAPLAITSGGSSGFKWPKNRLTYSIETWSSDLPRDDVRRAIAEAYGTWAKVTNLQFEEVPAGGNSDIKIRFGINNHNDPWPFDGKGGVLAHATMPESGMFHFDDDENWAYMDARKIASTHTDILAVAIHEGGHTLGLEHSRDESAIMAPFYQPTVDDNGNYVYPKLKSDDIQAIQSLYGRNTGGGGGGSSWGGSGGSSFTTSRPMTTTTKKSWFGRFFGDDDDVPTTSRPSRPSGGSGSGGSCPFYIDGFTPSDSYSYLFSGSQVYIISGTRVTRVQSIRDLFPGGPSSVTAAVFNPISGKMLLFANGQVYAFYYSRLRASFDKEPDFPKRLPSDLGFQVTGALRWVNGHQILMGDNDEFAVYDEFWNQVTLRNRISSYFPNLPRGVKGAESPSGMTVKAFTSSEAFDYDSRRKTIGQHQSLSSYLTCA